MLGNCYSGTITTTYRPESEAQDRGPLAGHVVIAYGLPDQPGAGLALTTGVCRLDVVGYDGHVDHNYRNDRREYI